METRVKQAKKKKTETTRVNRWLNVPQSFTCFLPSGSLATVAVWVSAGVMVRVGWYGGRCFSLDDGGCGTEQGRTVGTSEQVRIL